MIEPCSGGISFLVHRREQFPVLSLGLLRLAVAARVHRIAVARALAGLERPLDPAGLVACLLDGLAPLAGGGHDSPPIPSAVRRSSRWFPCAAASTCSQRSSSVVSDSPSRKR